MFPAFYVLLGMAFFGFSNACWKPVLGDFKTGPALFLRSFLSVAIFLLLYYLQNTETFLIPGRNTAQNFSLNLDVFLKSTLAILISLAGLWFFVESIRHSGAGISGIVVSCSSILSAINGWWLLKEPIHPALVAGLAVSAIGVLLLDDWKSWKKPSARGISMALLGAVCWSLSNSGFKYGIDALGVIPFCLLQETTVLTISGMATGIQVLQNRKIQIADHGYGSLATISCCTVLGVLFCNLGMNQLSLAAFSLLVLVQPLTTLFFASIWLKETFTTRQLTGASLILAGIFIGLSSR